ncbi:PE family protein [Mycobacterium ulcerans]|uniref:PE family protein n=1 Tax=Mycobacterium ulcerans TaxID=1809 RepID=UPI00223931C7|nr:PE family protein [Mycobacterium ulcerans]
MSFVVVDPEMVAATAADLANIGSTIGAANGAAAATTRAVLAAGGGGDLGGRSRVLRGAG